MSEKSIMHSIMIAMTKAASRMFRNHVGLAYQGKAQRFTKPTTVVAEPGDVLIRKARTVKAGLITGSSDLVGWTSRMMTEHDLGRTYAIFTACEVKTELGSLETEQDHFLKVVKDSGGFAIVARCAEDAVNGIQQGGNYETGIH